MISFSRGVVLALAAAAVAGAAPQALAQKPSEGGGITFNRADDAEMVAAQAAARRTLDRFFELLADPPAGADRFMVKYDLNEGRGTAEFIWVEGLTLLPNGQLVGTLANHPINRAYTYGQRVVVPQDYIVDWSYVGGGVAQGNYTTRVQLERLPPDQAARVRASLGW